MCCIALCLTVSSSSLCICNLEDGLFWIILAVGTDVMWKDLGEVQSSPALGYWQSWFALKLRTGNTSYYLKKIKLPTMVMFATVLFYGRVCSKAEISPPPPPGLLLQKCQICHIQSFLPFHDISRLYPSVGH